MSDTTKSYIAAKTITTPPANPKTDAPPASAASFGTLGYVTEKSRKREDDPIQFDSYAIFYSGRPARHYHYIWEALVREVIKIHPQKDHPTDESIRDCFENLAKRLHPNEQAEWRRGQDEEERKAQHARQNATPQRSQDHEREM